MVWQKTVWVYLQVNPGALSNSVNASWLLHKPKEEMTQNVTIFIKKEHFSLNWKCLRVELLSSGVPTELQTMFHFSMADRGH